MAETLGAKPKAPKKQTPPADNVVQLDNVAPEDRLRETLLNGVADLRKFDEQIATAMSKVKALRSDRKAVVGKMGAAGLPASLIKEAMDDADNTRTDVGEKEKARSFIRDTFNLPTADWAKSLEGTPSAAQDDLNAEASGYTAAVMNKERTPPTELSPERGQAWLRGYDAVLKSRAMDLTAKPKAAPEPIQEPVTLTLVEADFADGTALEDASMATIKDESRAQVGEVGRVIVRFGDKQRLLKDTDGYLDDGTEEAGLSEITDVPTDAA